VRLGRVVNPYGLYNDTRDMPFTRPSIFLPQSIYFDINRNTALSGDGIQLYGEHRTDYGDFLLQFNGMESRANDPAWKPVLFARSVEGQLSWVGRLMYEWQGGRVRLGVTSADLNVGFQPRQVDYKAKSNLSFAPVLFSFQYNAEDWSLTSEYAIRYSEVDSLGQKVNFAGESYYVQGTYRFTTELEAFLRYDVYYGDRNDRNGKKLQASGLGSAQEAFAKDIAVGLRWDLTQSIMLRTEYHYVDGAGWLYVGENKDGLSKYWNMFAASISFRF